MRSFCRCGVTHDEECVQYWGEVEEKRGENQLIRNLHSSHQLTHECGNGKLFSLEIMHY